MVERPVRIDESAFEPVVAKSMIEEEAGKHFDPEIVDVFRARLGDFLDIRKWGEVAEENPVPV